MYYLTNKKAVYYTVIKHDGYLSTRGKWVFDQSERAQGPIYIVIVGNNLCNKLTFLSFMKTFMEPTRLYYSHKNRVLCVKISRDELSWEKGLQYI